MTKRQKKDDLLPNKFGKAGHGVRLIGKTKPMIAFGCGAVKVSEPTLDATIQYLEAKDNIKRKISRVNTEINKKQIQFDQLQIEINDLKIKRNQIENSVKMPKLVKNLNRRVYHVRNSTIERSLVDFKATTRHVKILKRFFNNKNK